MSEITILPPNSGAPVVYVPQQDISGVASDGQLVDMWLSECRSHHTYRLYENVCFRFLATLPHGLKGATVADVVRFEQSFAKSKATTKHTYLNIIRSLFSFARRTGYIQLSPAHVRRNRRPAFNLHKRCLDVDEVWSLIDSAQSEKAALLMRVLYGTSIRVAEALTSTWSDLHSSRNIQRLNVLGKGGRWREVSVPAWVGLVRPDWVTSEDFVFTLAHKGDPRPHKAMSYGRARQMVLEAALRSGIGKPVTPHWFRHSSLTHMQDAGMRPKDVQVQAGHTSLGTTSLYSHGREDIAPGDVLERKKPE